MAGSRRCETVRRSFRVAIRLRPTISRCIRLVVGQRRLIASSPHRLIASSPHRLIASSPLATCDIATLPPAQSSHLLEVRLPNLLGCEYQLSAQWPLGHRRRCRRLASEERYEWAHQRFLLAAESAELYGQLRRNETKT
jgi:hypothetical protein